MTDHQPETRLPGAGLHLLLDRRLIDERRNVTLKLAPCEKHAANPLKIDGGDYWVHDNLSAMIRWLPDEKLFRGVCQNGMSIASEDGIAWRREAGGEKVLFLSNDPDPDPARRYKRVFHLEGTAGEPVLGEKAVKRAAEMGIPPEAGIGVSWSADGTTWRHQHPILKSQQAFTDTRTNVWGGGDGYNHAIWAPDLRKYVCFVRTNIDRRAYGGRKERSVGRMESDDFIHWSEHEICLRPWTDLNDKLGRGKFDFYHLPVFRYGGVYLSMLSVFHWKSDTVHLQLAWSPDTRHWEVVCPDDDFIPHGGTPGSEADGGKIGSGVIDAGCNFACYEPILIGDQMRCYYGGSPGLHNRDSGRESGLCLARFKRDRFAGIQPEDSAEPALAVCRPVEVEGRSLTVNVNAAVPGAELRVELRTPAGQPIKPFTFDTCDPIRVDAVRHMVTWNNRRDLSQQLGRDVRVAFEMRKARVYAFAFRDGV